MPRGESFHHTATRLVAYMNIFVLWSNGTSNWHRSISDKCEQGCSFQTKALRNLCRFWGSRAQLKVVQWLFTGCQATTRMSFFLLHDLLLFVFAHICSFSSGKGFITTSSRRWSLSADHPRNCWWQGCTSRVELQCVDWWNVCFLKARHYYDAEGDESSQAASLAGHGRRYLYHVGNATRSMLHWKMHRTSPTCHSLLVLLQEFFPVNSSRALLVGFILFL